jgi:TRAP transporter TAXI family solute receptor
MLPGKRLLGAALIAVAAIVGLVVLASSYDRNPADERRISLTIATGGQGGAFYPLGQELSRLYASSIPGVVTRVESGGSGQNVQSIEEGRAQVAFTQADVAYIAYRRGTETDRHPYAQLRGIAVLWMNTVQIAVPRNSPVRSVSDLRGRRVSVGTAGSGSETLARIVLESYGLGYEDIRAEFLSFVLTTEKMRTGAIDAAFIVAGLPTAAISQLIERPGLRLLPIPREHVREMRAQYPFLQPLVVPRGTYPGVDADIETLGVSSLLTCRKDLDQDLVYQLTKLLFDALPRLTKAHPVARLIDLEQAPATPIPLHAGAARYYRERELFQ